jgi:hypothetical protein
LHVCNPEGRSAHGALQFRPACKRGNGNPVKRKLATFFENIRASISSVAARAKEYKIFF